VDLLIQHAMRMLHIVNCDLYGHTVFSTLSHKTHDFQKKIIKYKLSLLILSTAFVCSISLSNTNTARYSINVRTAVFTVNISYFGEILIKIELNCICNFFEKKC
jgi:hypothetical protein